MDGRVDSSELAAFGAKVEQLRSLGCQVVGVAGESLLSIRQVPDPALSLPTIAPIIPSPYGALLAYRTSPFLALAAHLARPPPGIFG